MRKEDQFKVEYEDEDERDKLLKKFKKADIPDEAIDDDEDKSRLLIDSEWSDVTSEVVDKYNTLKEKRVSKTEVLEG